MQAADQPQRAGPRRVLAAARRPGHAARADLVVGIAFAVVALVVVGFTAALLECTDGATRGLCAGSAWLVPVLEWPIFVAAVVAPLAGGIASFVKRNPFWLAVGIGTAVVMAGLMAAVSTGQTSVLS